MQHPSVLVHKQCSGNTAHICHNRALYLGGELLLQAEIGDCQTATGLEHSEDLIEYLRHSA